MAGLMIDSRAGNLTALKNLSQDNKAAITAPMHQFGRRRQQKTVVGIWQLPPPRKATVAISRRPEKQLSGKPPFIFRSGWRQCARARMLTTMQASLSRNEHAAAIFIVIKLDV